MHEQQRPSPLAAPARPRLVVHVGTPKTGTTTIRRALAILAPELRRRGVHVPGGRAQVADHASLSHALKRRRFDPGAGPLAALAEEVRGSDAAQFVVSHPSLSLRPYGRAPRRLAAFAESTGLEVRVIGFVRPQYQYLESRYAQNVKTGWETRPFEWFAAEKLAAGRVPRYDWLHYRRVFAPWREAFGERVTIVPLTPARLPEGLVAGFLALLGLTGLPTVADANRRLGAREIEVRRLAAAALARRHAAPALVRRLVDLPRLLGPDAPFAPLARGQAAGLMARFAADNAALAREYGIGGDAPPFGEAVDDALVRPAHAEWWDLDAAQRGAVRDYVRRTIAVDPAPAPRRRRAPPRAGTAPIGSARWLAPRLLHPRFLAGIGATLARRWRRRLHVRLGRPSPRAR